MPALVVAAILSAGACGDSATPDPFTLEELQPGSTLHTVDERFRRHGPAEPVLAQHESYQPETLRHEAWMEFDERGNVISMRSESRTEDGELFARSFLDDGEVVYEEQGVEVRRTPLLDLTIASLKERIQEAIDETRTAADDQPESRVETLNGVEVFVLETRRPFTRVVTDVSPTSYHVPYLYDLRPIVEEIQREYVWIEGDRSLRSEIVMVSEDRTETIVESTDHLVFEVLQ